MSAHLSRMTLRRFLAALAALALVWAPLALQGGAAMATAPADHHAQMMQGGDCHDKQSDQKGHSSGKVCCAAMCTAIVVPPVVTLEPAPLAGSTSGTSLAESGPSYLAELPTPPPRLA